MLLLPALAFIVFAFIVPVLALLRASFHSVDIYGLPVSGFSVDPYREIFTSSTDLEAMWQTPLLSLQVTVLTLVLAYVIAASIVRTTSGVLRALMYLVVLSPLLTSVVVRTYGWVVLLSDSGPINQGLVSLGLFAAPHRLLFTHGAVLVGMVHVMLPFAVLPIVAAMGDVERFARAATTLGAGRVRTFLRVTLPLSSHGAMTAGILVFVISMGTYITPQVLGGNSTTLLATLVATEAQQMHNTTQSAAVSFVLLVLTALCVTAVGLLFRTWHSTRFTR